MASHESDENTTLFTPEVKAAVRKLAHLVEYWDCKAPTYSPTNYELTRLTGPGKEMEAAAVCELVKTRLGMLKGWIDSKPTRLPNAYDTEAEQFNSDEDADEFFTRADWDAERRERRTFFENLLADAEQTVSFLGHIQAFSSSSASA